MPKKQRSTAWEVGLMAICLWSGFYIGLWVHNHITANWLDGGTDPFATVTWVVSAFSLWRFVKWLDGDFE